MRERCSSASGRRLTLVDFGAADGLATGQLLEALPAEALPSLDVVLQDVPANDWQAANAMLEPLGTTILPLAAQAGGAAGDGLRLFSAPGSFHEAVLPEKSIDFAVSGTSFHWLSDTSALPRTGGVLATSRHRLHINFQAHLAWLAHAARDWDIIVDARAAELLPGGTFACVQPCWHTDGSQTYAVLWEILDEVLDARHAAGSLMPGYREQFAVEQGKPKEVLLDGLAKSGAFEDIRVDEVLVPSPLFDAAEIASGAEGRAAFGRRYAASVHGFLGGVIKAAVRDSADEAAFYAEIEARCAVRAEELEVDYAVATVVARRR